MPIYTSAQSSKSGVPLGGLGAGKLELFPNGTLDLFTIQNNWVKPLTTSDRRRHAYPDGLLGFHFAVAYGKSFRRVLLLQTSRVASYPTVRRIVFDGRYPCAELTYEDARLPVDITLSACSLLIPGRPDDSAWPSAWFRFTFRNRTRSTQRLQLISMARNTTGRSFIGRYNRVQQSSRMTSLVMGTHHEFWGDASRGEVALSVHHPASRVSYVGEWNLQTKDFQFDRSHVRLEPLDLFMGGAERLPNTNTGAPIDGGGVELGGGLAASVTVPARGTKSVDVSLSWFFPAHHAGHVYERRFRSARQVSAALAPKAASLMTQTRRWQRAINNWGLPDWLSDALINNLYPLTSASMWTRRNAFALLESPREFPLVGTLDVAFYASIPLALLFPSLDRNWLALFAKAQRRDGYIPHDLGNECFDAPSNGTTNFLWKDLAPKFVLMVYRNARWSRDLRWARRMFPAVERAMRFVRACDTDGDGLPENEGADQTFDLWSFRGVNVYTAGVTLAALKAYATLARLMKRPRLAQRTDRWFRTASERFETLLWNGRYFVAAANQRDRYDVCMTAQLAGQWMAHQLRLGYLVDPAKVNSAVSYLMRHNAKASRYGAPNALRPNGTLDRTSRHARTIWPGQSYALAALAVFEGYPRAGLALARRTWDTFVRTVRNPWDQPDVLFPEDASYGFGDAYMRSMSIWSIPLALARSDRRVASGLAKLCAQAGTRCE